MFSRLTTLFVPFAEVQGSYLHGQDQSPGGGGGGTTLPDSSKEHERPPLRSWATYSDIREFKPREIEDDGYGYVFFFAGGWSVCGREVGGGLLH